MELDERDGRDERDERDLTKTDTYERLMDAAVKEKRAWLRSMGYNPDDPKDRKTCEWLTWHLTK